MRTKPTLAGITIALLALTGCSSTPDEAAPVAAETQESAETPTAEETGENGLPDEERSANLEQTIKDNFGVDSFTQLLTDDPTMWAGYIANIRVEKQNAYITLQVDRNTPDGKDLGERAAKALSTLLTKKDVEGIDWLIVEDGTGVVIAQEKPNPLI